MLARVIDLSIRKRAMFAMQAMLSAAPEEIRVRDTDGAERMLPARCIEVGMQAVIAAGETVAVDGVVLNGQSDLDRSRLTGESSPVRVQAGDLIEAGVINITNCLVVRVTASYGNRRADLIAR